MSAIFVLLPILSYALVFNIFLKKAISVSIFFAITFIISILFLFGMFDLLKSASNTLFYGGIALLLFILGLAFGFSVIVEFANTSKISKIPSAILSVGLILTSLLTLFSGFILDTIVKQYKQNYFIQLKKYKV